jgi:hypothetical protein
VELRGRELVLLNVGEPYQVITFVLAVCAGAGAIPFLLWAAHKIFTKLQKKNRDDR